MASNLYGLDARLMSREMLRYAFDCLQLVVESWRMIDLVGNCCSEDRHCMSPRSGGLPCMQAIPFKICLPTDVSHQDSAYVKTGYTSQVKVSASHKEFLAV